ncbi:hypothetical protein [Actinomadura decatromicini]|uniref:Uncharacterized protein n=1 Tax=Actinomadura decatromicini TaxID=2604572 RepID=A0A5D3FBC9_9ACTN|nr:hypothetical protein [Actinomadura decatromicini]TYK45146.1 hypothetical protein FXF68_31185 [Actinomadura decatromicini]
MDATPGTAWVDTGLPHVRVFASADSESALTCNECGRPVGGEAFVTDHNSGTVTATHERCLPEEEHQEAVMAHHLSRLEKRLSDS